MLILSRAKNESIVINGEIEILICDVRGSGTVKVGVTAPKDMKILRREVADRTEAASME